jgi:hypothetical protein
MRLKNAVRLTRALYWLLCERLEKMFGYAVGVLTKDGDFSNFLGQFGIRIKVSLLCTCDLFDLDQVSGDAWIGLKIVGTSTTSSPTSGSNEFIYQYSDGTEVSLQYCSESSKIFIEGLTVEKTSSSYR